MSTNFEDLIGRGNTASKPTAGIPGRLYFDTTENKMYRDNGSSWDEVEGVAGGAGSDTTAIHDNVSDEIHSISEKVSPVIGDVLVIEDSESSWAKKRIALSSIPFSGGMANPMTTTGDIIYATTDGTPARLAAGQDGYVLTAGGAGVAPAWEAPASTGSSYTAPPVLSGWTQENLGTGGSAADDSSAIKIIGATSGSGDNLRVIYRAAPSPSYTITLAVSLTHVMGTCGLFIGWRNTGDAKLQGVYSYSGNILKTNWNSATSWASESTYGSAFNIMGPVTWFRLSDNNTNRKLEIGRNGTDFVTLFDVTRTEHLATPGNIAVGLYQNTYQSIIIRLLSYA